MMEADSVTRDPMLDLFVFETLQLIEQLEELLLEAERNHQYSQADIHEIFRIMHTVKGSSAMMGFDSVSHLAHALEDLFDHIRSAPGARLDDARLTDLVLQSIDFIKRETGAIEQGLTPDGCPEPLIRSVRSTLDRLRPNPDGESCAYEARLFFERDCLMENLRAYSAIVNLAPVADVLDTVPADILDGENSVEIIRESGFLIRFVSDESREKLQACLEQTMFLDRLELTAACAITVDEAVTPDDTTGTPGTAASDGVRQANGKPQSIISVSIGKMDQLMDLVGELVISVAMVTGNPELAGLRLHQFQKASRQLHKLTNELQDAVMSIRMVPIAATFQKMQRIVRDMNRKLMKNVTLIVDGEETEVDKRIVDSLTDPLMHLIRNALDHGIESPEERIGSGKPEQGALHLTAANVGGDVWITIRDDGRGLDCQKILAKARERQLLTKPEHEYTEKELFSFILLPGFSTRNEVSEFSGRGVGLDVVRENISRVGGTVGLDSQPGAGTTITIRIPLTLAIINGMQIAVGQASYIVPITAIRQSFRIRPDQIIRDMDGQEMVMVRDACLAVLRLHRRFGVESEVKDLENGIIVVVENQSRTVCLFADALVGEQQVVVKPLPPSMQHASGVAGCTILGDGGISLILDIGGLIESTR